jgi:hypothetical protein
MWEANKLQVETEEVTVRDFTFDFNTGCFTHGSPVLVKQISDASSFSFFCCEHPPTGDIEILVSRLQLSRGANRLFGAKGVTFLAQIAPDKDPSIPNDRNRQFACSRLNLNMEHHVEG